MTRNFFSGGRRSAASTGSSNRLLAIAAALLASMLVVVSPASPAHAHTELSRTSPAARSTVSKAVTAVTLTFSGLIKKPGTTVVVTGPDKVSYSDADAQVLDKTITQKVKPLPVGAITVVWRTVSADGHTIKGSFTFTNRVAPPTPTAAPTPTAEPTPTVAPTTPPAASPAAVTNTDGGGSSPALWWAVILGAVLAVAVLGGLLLRRRRSTGV
ncbi:copper resistance CopC family protein [Plantactinospora sp. BB1]|uniref:copper resistance CopC family protein n=1 Tax=Plantactinospora sp. BB1 TaxID=2071627 RepID=UPI000D1756F4|nr:copper resistance CopC family protein [Plantactinospora sp. BB1]AVT40612.1 copper resistance protein CopC [Plantactinospora sp. BB1]